MCKHSDFLWLSMRSQRDQGRRTPTQRPRTRIRFQSLSSNRFPSVRQLAVGAPYSGYHVRSSRTQDHWDFYLLCFSNGSALKVLSFIYQENLPVIEFKPFYPQCPPFAFMFYCHPKRGPCTSPSLSFYLPSTGIPPN